MQIGSETRTTVLRVLLALLILPLFGVVEPAAMPGSTDYKMLEDEVASLQLGFGEYHIAQKLTQVQKTQGQKSLQANSYPGTYTFTNGDIFVLAEKDRDVVLALYKKNEEAGREQMRAMVAELMSLFENPTSEAHDQIIYWAYSKDGKISDSVYKDMKKEGESSIIATVKFKSKLTFTDIDGESNEENSIHCIVSSPQLLERFYQQ